MPRTHLRILAITTMWAAASACVVAADVSLDYDRTADLAVTVLSSETRGQAIVRDVTFAAAPGEADGGRTAAWIAAPAANPTAPLAGILWVHWLGEPETTNRSQFLEEALALAELGVISVLPDTMWAKPHWYRDRVLEEDFAKSVRQVIALRRALDVLLAQPGVDRARIGFVGHDYGAMYGTIALALHGGVRTAVFIAPTASLNDWAFFLNKPESMDAYLVQNRPLELVDHLRAIKGASTLMQFAEQDRYVPLAKVEEFFAAANEPKTKRIYAGAGHEMTAPAEIRAERTAWLVRELGLNP